tara:strand:- start:24 stop:269 length:246 start_codon:yes stop_codon:yes gene_type:complete
MNIARRKRIIKVIEIISEQKDILTEICEEETEAQDNTMEGIRETEKFLQDEEHLSDLESLADDLDTTYNEIQQIFDIEYYM